MPDIKRIKALFDALQELPNEQQAAYLIQSDCSNEEREQVLRLLGHASNEASNFVPQQAINTKIQEISAQIQQGQMLGPYRILEEVGRGGMGVVFLAERADGQYQQQVAIKLAPSFSTSDEQQQFSIERQLLAELQHPNIAMLLDGGITDDHRPYLVMEYVKGANLTDYCRQQQLTINEKLDLFLKVCEAVAYAHNRLIIHRDIKAENVLVNEEGIVKLLDFGTSKLLQQSDDSNATQVIAMTLSCASPEQVSGDKTTTATDVYGLGALLYQLLADTTPYIIDKANMAVTFDSILNQTPIPPSRLQKDLAKDLDNICLKALEKDPERRYLSVGDFQRDIKHFLQGKVVSATKPSLIYRLSKLIKRHPLPASLASALSIALISGLVITTDLNQKLTVERNNLIATQADLRQQTNTAEKVIELLTDMFDAASPENAQGEAISIDKLVNSAISKTHNTLTHQPAVKSRLLSVLSKVQNSLGQDQQAVALMEEAFQLKQQNGKPPTVVDVTELGNAYVYAGQFDQALKYLRQAEQMAQAPDVNAKDRALVDYNLGIYFTKQSQFSQALGYYRKADAYWQQHPDEQDTTPLEIRFQIAYVHYYADEYSQVIEILTKLLADTTKLFGENHPQNLNTLRMLSNSYRQVGDYKKAEASIVSAYELAHKILEPDSQLNQAVTQAYAYLLTDLGRYQEEIDILNQALARELSNPITIGGYHSYRGQANLQLGYFQASKDDFEQALTLLSPHYADSTLETFPARMFLAYSRSFLGEADIAERALDELYKQAERQFQEGDYNFGLISLLQGAVALNNHDLEKAGNMLKNAKANFDAYFPPGHIAHVSRLRIQGDYYLAMQQWQEADKVLSQAWALVEKYHPPGSIEGLVIKIKRAKALWHEGKTQKAQEIVAEAAPFLQQQLKPDSQYYQIAEQTLRLVGIRG